MSLGIILFLSFMNVPPFILQQMTSFSYLVSKPHIPPNYLKYNVIHIHFCNTLNTLLDRSFYFFIL